jgi:hypothetical protein
MLATVLIGLISSINMFNKSFRIVGLFFTVSVQYVSLRLLSARRNLVLRHRIYMETRTGIHQDWCH